MASVDDDPYEDPPAGTLSPFAESEWEMVNPEPNVVLTRDSITNTVFPSFHEMPLNPRIESV